MRSEFPKLVNELMDSEKDVYLLLGDIGVFGFSDVIFEHPGRAVNLGIAEQASVSLAAGLAREGNYPIFHTIAPFLVDRAFEQLKVDFGYSKQSGLFVSVGASFDYGKLGGTHHCPEDISLLSTIEGVNIYLPGSQLEFQRAFKKAAGSREFAYIRLESSIHKGGMSYENGRSFDFGNNGTIIAVSHFMDSALQIAEELKMNVQYLNEIPNDFGVDRNVFQSDLFILEPFMKGSTRTALERSGTIFQGRVQSLGFPREFRRGYVHYQQHLIDAGLDYNGLLEKIKLSL